MHAQGAPYSLELRLQECQGLHSKRDVIEVTALVARLGLRPGVGAWIPGGGPQPVPDRDISAHQARVRVAIDELRQTTQPRAARPRRRDPFEGDEVWGFGVVTPELPAVGGTLSIGRAVRGSWAIALTFYTWHAARARQPVAAFATAGGERLSRVGDALYRRTRPALGLLTVETDEDEQEPDEELDPARAVAARRFLAGWRTWFGPPYAEAFGREWLLGLPGTAVPLEDGGVHHALDAPAPMLVDGDPAVYAPLWPYVEDVEAAGVTPAWPRPPQARRRPSSADTDRDVTKFRRSLYERQ